MNVVKIRANALSCTPYYFKDGDQKGQVKGFILEFFEVKVNRDGIKRAEVSKYFPSALVLSPDVAKQISLFTPLELCFDIRSLSATPSLVSVSVLPADKTFKYQFDSVVDIDKF